MISTPGGGAIRLPDGTRETVDAAVFHEFKAAFRRWYSRCHADPDNIALFFFCGHGWDRDGQLLLLEDVGKDPHAVFEHCVELSEVRALMQHCRARTQLYFVDACRQMPSGFFQLVATALPLMDRPERVTLPLAPLDAPVYFSTAKRFDVENDVGAVTPFTAAVLRTLDGLGAHRNGANQWTIATDRFGPHLRDVMAWDYPEADRWAFLTVEGEQSGASVLRTLDGPPRVPFRLTCSPAGALAAAAAKLRHVRPSPEPPLSVAADGRGEVIAGVYQLHLEFPTGTFREESVFEEVLPPNKTWHAQVNPA
ncbi:caspase family protein [Dactylosporangium sp. NPDC005572]|uniref:caspase family protein n=1 Tax=Dactylosporangium sp. NPDC005572 TaxID=3156889 RepID=UPI0033B172C9